MEKEIVQNLEREILDHAIEALADAAGVQVRATKTTNPKADYDLKIEMPGQKEVLVWRMARLPRWRMTLP